MVETSVSQKQGFIEKPKPPTKLHQQTKHEKSTFETIKEKAYQVAEAITEAIDESMEEMSGMPLGFAATIATGTSAPTMHVKRDSKLNDEQLQLARQIEDQSQDIQYKTRLMLEKFSKDRKSSTGLNVGEWLHDASETIVKTADRVLHPKEHHGHDVQHRTYLRGGSSSLSKS